ncbi:MAG: hypothetical protein J6Q82_03985 [Clostridia bacterium]|nr:hypothetical protein [Clostridia bacterium]
MKYDYFETLEQLSLHASDAVRLACAPKPSGDTKSISSLRKRSDKLICELEDALFSDFLPPLERETIAGCAHCLSRVVDQASELLCHASYAPPLERQNEEGLVCLRLCEKMCEAISLLRRIRKPDELPDMQGFRSLLAEGRRAHGAMLSRVHSGILPKSAAQTIILTGRLRAEISHAFDVLVEIMLNNI